MPNNVKDRLASSQTTNCVEEKNPVEEPEVVENEEVIVENEDNNEELMLSLNNIATSQEVIYSQMNSSFAELYQAISNLSVLCSNSASDEIVEPVIDEKEQQRLELQAQIEALQAQMQSL